MINEQDKQRIEKEAEVYTVSSNSGGYSFWQGMYRGYVAGATAELERSEKLLQEYREALKKALGYTQELSSIYTDTECVQIKSEIDSFYKKAKSLIEPKPDKA